MTICIPILSTILVLLYFIINKNSRNGFVLTLEGLPLTLLILICCILIITSMKFLKPQKDQGFDKVKDLVRGTITVNEIG